MQISINNEKHSFEQPLSVDALLQQLNIVKEKHAVAVNGDFVPRSNYNEHYLNDGDEVDILTAVQGG